MTWLFVTAQLIISVVLSVTLGLLAVKLFRQVEFDHNRKSYIVTFPSNVSEEDIIAWLTSVSGSLDNGWKRIAGVRTIAFETWSTDTGIVHRMKVPWQWASDMAAQLHRAIPGINIREDTTRPIIRWTRAMQIGMNLPDRTLRIRDHANLSSSILRSLGQLEPGETVVIQWVATIAPQERPPARDLHPLTSEFTYRAAYRGRQKASHDEIEDRRRKLDDINFQAIGRIAAYAETEPRAIHLVERIWKKLESTKSNYNRLTHDHVPKNKLIANINDAAAPAFFPAQFSMLELAAVLGWSTGQSYIPGMPQIPALQLPATEDIPRDEVVIGNSNYYGNERPIGISYSELVRHLFIAGKPGVGKTTAMSNVFRQVVEAGHGAFVIDTNDSTSNQSMYNRVLSIVPLHRLPDVVIIDASTISDMPVGFNILDQGSPRTVVNQIVNLLDRVSGSKSMWARQLASYGLRALIETPGTTFMDLLTLLDPKTDAEKEWAQQIIDNVKDYDIREFFDRWNKYERAKQLNNIEPLLNRIWEISSSPEVRNVIGQKKSAFQMSDLIRDHKILIVTTRGSEGEAGNVLATFLIQALWTAAQRVEHNGYNYLFLDEVQLLEGLPVSVRDMLTRARQLNFGLILATQYLGQLSTDLRSAILNNTGSRIVFEVASEEANTWSKEFGPDLVSPEHLKFIPPRQAIAQISTATGGRRPITLNAAPPPQSTSIARQLVETSAQQYGRPRDEVERMMRDRKTGDTDKQKGKRPNVGIRKWGKSRA